jgi:hypothetical protein
VGCSGGEFLAHETLFPFAVLGLAASRAERGAVLETVIGKAESAIGSGDDGADRYTAEDAARTIEITATLASIYLKRSTIREILERNNNMTVLLRDFPLSQSFLEEGRQEGRQEGRLEGMEALLTLARARHGELSAPLMDALASSHLRLTELTEIVLNASNQIELERLLET